jgi:tripeptide aminopeptidase
MYFSKEQKMTTPNSERLINTFLDLVRISSPSWKEEGVIRYIERAAMQLGYEAKRYPCGESFNLVVSIPGDNTKKPILFGAHTDTVTPCENIKPIVTAAKISSDGNTILGGDDKAAVAAFIEAMRVIRESGMSTPPLEFIFTCAEEIGLKGMKGMEVKNLRSKRGFMFDCSGPIGTVIVKAPSQIVFKVEITGRAAHAGIEPEKGVSAIDCLADIVTKIPKGRLDKETTSNIGVVSGGRATNIVAEKASFDMEVRSLNPKKLSALKTKIVGIMKKVAKSHKAKIRIDSFVEYAGFSIPHTDPLVQTVSRACTAIKLKPVIGSSGGGSDTNVLNGKGVRAVNLSIGMANVHSTREFIMKKDIIKGCALVLSIARQG